MDVYPLIFEPLFKKKIWGGRKLETLLGKSLPPGEPIGETWEIADLEDDHSAVANGPAKGMTLTQLVSEWGTALTGRAPLVDGRFPLLIKFLDATETLSLQVHPDKATAKRLGGRVRVKHEAWYIIDAEADGFIYRGLAPGVDREALRHAVEAQDVDSVLNRIPVRKGHCYYLPSGTIHALGGGVTVAEVQTPSDITYRLYDWNRIDSTTGQLRELHLEEALRCISFEAPPQAPEKKQHVASLWTTVTSLVRCEAFTIDRVRMVEGIEQHIPYEELVIWIVLEGGGEIAYDGSDSPMRFGAGDSVVIPAGLKGGRVKTTAPSMWLEVTVPIASSLTGYERPSRQSLAPPTPVAGFVPLNMPQTSDAHEEKNRGETQADE